MAPCQGPGAGGAGAEFIIPISIYCCYYIVIECVPFFPFNYWRVEGGIIHHRL